MTFDIYTITSDQRPATMTTSTVTNSTGSSTAIPWVERYRPKSLHDVSHQTEVVATLQNAVRTGRLPHLLFYGPPGSGKTSVALALCRQLWHPSQWKRRVLELNASDERGISVVRDKIKQFAVQAVGQSSSKSFFTTQKTDSNAMEEDTTDYPNPPYKIIILDECDSVTPDAQAALRRIIVSTTTKTTSTQFIILLCSAVLHSYTYTPPCLMLVPYLYSHTAKLTQSAHVCIASCLIFSSCIIRKPILELHVLFSFAIT